MKRLSIVVLSLGLVALLASIFSEAALAGDAPADRVVVMYFHRTQRCPTCLKMGSYTEEAVKKGFAQEIKAGRVEFHYIDFQDQKNDNLTRAYNVSGPTLIVCQVVNNKVKEYKNLTEMWSKVGDKPAFVAYIQDNVKSYRR
jgi:thiol-disulfide isomerase/thioredoxin